MSLWFIIITFIIMGGGGLTFPEGVYEKMACGTYCRGLVDKVMFDRRLDLMISMVISNLVNPVIIIIIFINICLFPSALPFREV